MRGGGRVLAIALFALPFDADTAGAVRAHLIYRVDRVSAIVDNGKLIVDASGAVASGGWSHARLRVKPSAPEAPVLEMEFIANPPSPKKVVIQTTLPVKAQLKAGLPHYGTVAVSVVAETNEITAQIRH
jgi:hypothetical protein